MTSDEHIKLYEEKFERLKKDKEAKEKRKAEREQRMLEKDLECRRGGANTRGGITRLTNQRTQRNTIKTRGGKQGSFFRPAEKESKEEHTRYKSVNTPEEGHKRSSRNVKAPSRFSYAAKYESSSEFQESSDEEDWECKECGGDEGSSDEYIGCHKCSRC